MGKPVFENLTGRHPYYRPFGCRTFKCAGLELHIGYARGYNAMGLIGTEKNGIFMLCKTHTKIVFDELEGQAGCFLEDDTTLAKASRRLSEIAAMSKAELQALMRQVPTLRYDPYAFECGKEHIKKHDKALRKSYRTGSFTDAKYRTADEQRKTVHDFERLLLARIHGSPALAESKFSKRLYELIHLKFGYIAHYNRETFYRTVIEPADGFKSLVGHVAGRRTTYGSPVCQDEQELPMFHALQVIASAYLPEIHEEVAA